MNKRNGQIDVMRGIGILLMVYGHCCRANSLIALFHMSLFSLLVATVLMMRIAEQ